MLIKYVDPYLAAKQSEWAPTTYKSETARLKALGASINLAPKELHKKLQDEGAKPYSIKTLFIRLANLQVWAGQENTYGQYLQTHKNRFKHAYQREEVEISYEEAQARINQLDPITREMALGILLTGVRLSEAYKVQNRKVEGKGGKFRKVFGEVKATVPKHVLWRKLKEIGLKPHTLRKLCATRLAEKTNNPADLMKVFGWSNIRTAYQYLNAKNDEKLAELMNADS